LFEAEPRGRVPRPPQAEREPASIAAGFLSRRSYSSFASPGLNFKIFLFQDEAGEVEV